MNMLAGINSKNVDVIRNLGEELKRIRLKNGLSLADLQYLSNISVTYIDRIEKGEAPPLQVLQKLASALNVRVNAVVVELDE